MTFTEWILNIGWKCYMPFQKLYYRIKLKCSFGPKSLYSYKTVFEGNNGMGKDSAMIGGFLGKASYIADEVRMFNTHIGRYSSIGHRTATVNGSHPIDRVSIHPVFYRKGGMNGLAFYSDEAFDEFKFCDRERNISVSIGNDVWIGADVRIMEGVTIGDGAVIAAGSLVTQDVPAYEIWMGVPAKKYKDRFEDDIKQKMLEIKWWNWSEDDIRKSAEDFSNPDLFIKKYS